MCNVLQVLTVFKKGSTGVISETIAQEVDFPGLIQP
jgi:hypothetical protein